MSTLRSTDSPAVKAFDQRVVNTVMQPYVDEGCGICEQRNTSGELGWESHFSRTAHSKCVGLIKTAEKGMCNAINWLFQDNEKRNAAYRNAVTAVRAACEKRTIEQYCKDEGIRAITKLFDTVGIAAATQYAMSLTPQPSSRAENFYFVTSEILLRHKL